MVLPHDKKYRFTHPLVLEVKHEGDHITVLSQQYDVHGVGRTVAEAANDLRDMLIEMYEELTASEPNLSKYLSGQLKGLKKLITPR